MMNKKLTVEEMDAMMEEMLCDPEYLEWLNERAEESRMMQEWEATFQYAPLNDY